MDVSEDKGGKSFAKVAIPGTLMNVLNPKLSLFLLAFLPQFVPANSTGAAKEIIALALVFMAMTFVVFVGYGAFAASARDYVIRWPTVLNWIKRCFVGAFGLLGARLAFSD